jgi:hypothetical protein
MRQQQKKLLKKKRNITLEKAGCDLALEIEITL